MRTELEKMKVLQAWEGSVWWGSKRLFTTAEEFAAVVKSESDNEQPVEELAALATTVFMQPCIGECDPGAPGEKWAHYHPFLKGGMRRHECWEIDIPDPGLHRESEGER